MTPTVERVAELGERYLLPFGTKVAIAIAIFYLGRWASRWIVRGAGILMNRSGIDVSLRTFLADVVYAVLLVAVLTAALDSLGIQTTAVVAIFGAAGIAVGLALQGSLSNFAAGVMIIIVRIYKVGDVVVIGKYTGRIEAIRVFHTVLHTADNREILIPNGQIVTQPIENMTTLGRRRIELRIGVGHATDLGAVKVAVESAVKADPRVSEEPRPELTLVEIGADTLVLQIRLWTAVDSIPAVQGELVERLRPVLGAYAGKATVAFAAGA